MTLDKNPTGIALTHLILYPCSASLQLVFIVNRKIHLLQGHEVFL